MSPHDPSAAVSDEARALRFMEIQRRHMQVMTGIVHGRVDEGTVRELESLHAEYEALLRLGAPEYPLYALDDVRARMADVVRRIAHAHHATGRRELVLPALRRAATAFRDAGRPDEAEQIEEEIRQQEAFEASDFDGELLRAQQELDAAPAASLARVAARVRLGETYMRGGDDYSARQTLETALAELDALGHGDALERDAHAVLLDSLRAVRAGRATAGASDIEELVAVRALYARIYSGLKEIARAGADGDAAAAARALEYVERLSRIALGELTPEQMRLAIEAVDGPAGEIGGIRP